MMILMNLMTLMTGLNLVMIVQKKVSKVTILANRVISLDSSLVKMVKAMTKMEKTMMTGMNQVM